MEVATFVDELDGLALWSKDGRDGTLHTPLRMLRGAGGRLIEHMFER